MASSRSFLILGLSALLLSAPLLSACGGVREDLGLGRNPPDEFAVVERPPLSMPPDYGLRPPRPGAERPQNVDMSQEASEALFNGNLPASGGNVSDGEKALLAAAGTTHADPNIRETVDREAAQKVVASPHLVDRLLNGGGDDQKPLTTVDAEAEAARIKNAQATNQSITLGATPVIEKQESGWLGL
jgi:hypothetical protein